MNDSATVVITQRARPGADDAYRRWQSDIVEAARSSDGFHDVEVIEPAAGVQEDWVIVLHFDTPEHLADWLTSDVRRSHLEAGTDLLEQVHEHVIATPRGPTAPVAVVVARRPKPGQEAPFEACQRELLTLAAEAPGYIDAELFRPVSGSDEWTLLFRFANADSLAAWMASPERAAVRRQLESLVVSEELQTVGGGLGGWFPEAATPDQAAPPRWKQAFAVTLALFPTAWLLGRVISPVLEDWPTLAQLLTNAAGVVALTWLVMPLVNRLLAPWYATQDRRVDLAGAAGITGVLGLFAWILGSL